MPAAYENAERNSGIRKRKERKKIMKKRWILLATAVMVLSLTGCGQEKEKSNNVAPETGTLLESGESETEQSQEQAAQQEAAAATEPADQEQTDQDPAADTTEGAQQEAAAGGSWEDNFAVDTAAAAEFGGKIKEAVAAQDIEKLADLTAFPVYVGVIGDGIVVEKREDFIALGADALFTEEMMASIAGADENSLNPSKAGFTLYSGDGAPSITFGVQDGKLGISGIN
jgi:outer membrane murein-binding lipoprotein Lpp